MDEEKLKALAKFLNCEVEDLNEVKWDENTAELGNQQYLVLTDEEADEYATNYILDSLWSFNSAFIIEHSKLPYEAKEMLETFQREKCESANETVLALIDNIDGFIEDAIGTDGRGHFLSSYDGEENEEGDYYIYRVN